MPRAALRRAALAGFAALALTASAQAATSGTLVALNKAEDTASLIDLASGRIVATLPTGAGPHEVATSPDGRLAVLTNYGDREAAGSSLTVLDISRARVVRTIDLGDDLRPHGIRFLPGGDQVLVTVEESRAVLTVDVASGEITGRLATGQEISHMLAVTPDGSRAFVANIGSGTVTALDLTDGRHLGNIPTGEGAEGIDITPDGRHVWVTNRAADTVSVIDARSLEILATLPSPSFPIRATVTPDGRHVLVSHARSGDVAVFNALTRKEERRIPMELTAEVTEGRLFGGRFGDSSVPIGILMHPEGKQAYVANANADIISVLDLPTWKLDGYLTAGREPDGLAFSPRPPGSGRPIPGQSPATSGAGADSTAAAALTGFAAGDAQVERDLEQSYARSVTPDSARAALEALSSPPPETDGESPAPAGARSILAAFEAAGLDAGIWDFKARPAAGSGNRPDEGPARGFHAMARIPGSDFPAQVVLLGASLPADGDATAVAGLITVARGLGGLLESGWHPRRTIVLAAWDAGLPPRVAARAWVEQGPMDAARTTVAFLAADRGLGGPVIEVASTPDLRLLAARTMTEPATVEPPDGRGAAGVFISAGVPTVEIARPARGRTPPGAQEIGSQAAEIAAGARLWGRLALRLADAALPPNNMAVVAQRVLERMDEIEDAARSTFSDNPPPLRDLRRALVRLRDAGEDWNAALAAVLAEQAQVPRGSEGTAYRQALEQAGTAALDAGRLVGTSFGPRPGCAHLIYCADPREETPAIFLPGLVKAMEAGDRGAFVAENLILATAVSGAAARLLAAAAGLSPANLEKP